LNPGQAEPTQVDALPSTGPNAEQIHYWNRQLGPKWVALAPLLDGQNAPPGLIAIDRARIARGESILDVGCGCGETALQLAERVGPTGSVTGIDVAAVMLESARRRAAGFENVRFLNADAQTAPLPAARFDLVYSRFGMTFFADPEAAFANLRASLKPGGRLVFVCWQELARNPWLLVPSQAAAAHVPMPAPSPPDEPGPFSFSDPARVRQILAGAGFAEIAVDPLQYGLTVGGGVSLDQAVGLMLEIGPTGAALRASREVRSTVAGALRGALAPLETEGGVRMDAAVWIATASK
jgi:SAM-dependent methyltransferase